MNKVFLDVTDNGFMSSGLCKIILGFIIVRVGWGFNLYKQSFLFVVAMVTSRNSQWIAGVVSLALPNTGWPARL